MNKYFNRNNDQFTKSLNGIFVDKSDALDLINNIVDSNSQFLCVTRPRRFGKSMMASMINAYYSKGCDSKALFDNLNISKASSYPKHLNKRNVIWLDMQYELDRYHGNISNFINVLSLGIIKELELSFNTHFSTQSVSEALLDLYLNKNQTFIVIIDEWDAIFREYSHNKTLEKDYVKFLRELFKSENGPKAFIALAYITGILPLARYNSQSALNNFDEYNMLNPGDFAPFYGFTLDETKALCDEYGIDLKVAKNWYDGYKVGNYDILNPNSVVSYIKFKKACSYWTKTAAFDDVELLIESNFKGLKDDFVDLISKGSIKGFDFSPYNNDLTTIDDREKALTYLIHLGYLAYNEETRKIYIPNLEVKNEIVHGVLKATKGGIVEYIKQSREVLIKTILGNTKFVADAIADIHEHRIPIIHYNNENSLAITVDYAYIASLDYYEPSVREYPSGKGYADIVYIPRIEYLDEYPAIVVELKWDGSAEDAVAQIKERNYLHKVLEKTDNIILVGINYNSKSKVHSCVIEKFEAQI